MKDFVKVWDSEVLDPLQAKSIEYLNKFEKMYVISGTAIDGNHDGIADNLRYKFSFRRPSHLLYLQLPTHPLLPYLPNVLLQLALHEPSTLRQL